LAYNNRKYSPNSTLVPFNGAADEIGTSGKTLGRYGNDPAMGLPTPIRIKGRRYFVKAEWEAWKTYFFQKARAA
jgi:hypothetical protein